MIKSTILTFVFFLINSAYASDVSIKSDANPKNWELDFREVKKIEKQIEKDFTGTVSVSYVCEAVKSVMKNCSLVSLNKTSMQSKSQEQAVR